MGSMNFVIFFEKAWKARPLKKLILLSALSFNECLLANVFERIMLLMMGLKGLSKKR